MTQRGFLATLSILLVALGAAHWISARGVPVVLQTNLGKLPQEIAGFHGRDESLSREVYDVLGADLHVYRHYQSPSGKALNLYLGYYGTAKGGRTGHNPYACLPGAGWAIVENGKLEVRPAYHPEGVRINYVVASKDGINNVMLHWYQSEGTRVLATGVQQNVQRFVGRVLRNRDDGAYVQVSAFAGDGEVPVAREMIREFAKALMEILPTYWPKEG